MFRPGRAEVIVPNPALPTVDAGGDRLTLLKALNSSPRNWKYRRSAIEKFFAKPKSQFLKPGPHRVSRPTVPYGVV